MEKSAMQEFKEAILNVITERLKQDVELDDYDEGYIDALRFIVTDIDLQYIAKEREQKKEVAIDFYIWCITRPFDTSEKMTITEAFDIFAKEKGL